MNIFAVLGLTLLCGIVVHAQDCDVMALALCASDYGQAISHDLDNNDVICGTAFTTYLSCLTDNTMDNCATQAFIDAVDAVKETCGASQAIVSMVALLVGLLFTMRI